MILEKKSIKIYKSGMDIWDGYLDHEVSSGTIWGAGELGVPTKWGLGGAGEAGEAGGAGEDKFIFPRPSPLVPNP